MLGSVASLRRYPVKSMLGEELAAACVTPAGLAGDRRLAVVSRTTGKVASAKYPRLWRGLLTASARIPDEAVPGRVLVTLPDGRAMWSADPGIDAVLSAFLSQPVTLAADPEPGASLDRAVPDAVLRDGVTAEVSRIAAAAPAGTFVDYAPVHLLTTSTLRRIAELSPRQRADAERYRPNIVIRTAADGFAENDWLGRDLRIGGQLVLRVIARTPRCAMPTLAHGGLPRDADALRVPARHNRIVPFGDRGPEPCAGVYAAVLRPGRVRVGDRVVTA